MHSRSLFALLILLLCPVARAEDRVGTLHLDGESQISYSAAETFDLPEGSTIRFRFGDARADGSVPITILPDDLSIRPIQIGKSAAIAYALAAPASGTLRYGESGGAIELDATLVATWPGRPEVAPRSYTLRFTTGRAAAADAETRDSVSVDGQPAGELGTVRLVGAATNPLEAFPGPGSAVSAVLSGRFDWLPGAR